MWLLSYHMVYSNYDKAYYKAVQLYIYHVSAFQLNLMWPFHCAFVSQISCPRCHEIKCSRQWFIKLKNWINEPFNYCLFHFTVPQEIRFQFFWCQLWINYLLPAVDSSSIVIMDYIMSAIYMQHYSINSSLLEKMAVILAHNIFKCIFWWKWFWFKFHWNVYPGVQFQ